MACCEAGGFVYTAPLATQVDIPLVLIRGAGKLPPSTISVIKSLLHMLSSIPNVAAENRIEIDRHAVPPGAHMVVVDNVLSTGNTLCTVLQLLKDAGTRPEDVSVMIVAEFPAHRGRALLRQRGFGGVGIQSLLVFDGA